MKGSELAMKNEELVRMVSALSPEQKKLMIGLLQDLVEKQELDPCSRG